MTHGGWKGQRKNGASRKVSSCCKRRGKRDLSELEVETLLSRGKLRREQKERLAKARILESLS
jgi:hypothetical protein